MSAIPVIRVEPGRLADVVDQAVKALWAGQLAEEWDPRTNSPAFLIYRDGEYIRGEPNEAQLTLLLVRAARWEDAQGAVIDPPALVVKMVREDLHAWVKAVAERSCRRRRRQGDPE